MQAGDGYGDEYEDDVDGIVDPLAGLRGADETEGYGTGTPAEDEDALELDGGYAPYTDAEDEGLAQDDLLASADRLAAEDRPVEARLGGGRRRGLLGGDGGDGAGGGSSAGSTLFERMANLSRSTARDDDEDEEGEDSPALSIPRFLGRQNNQ
ncbi:MAG: hypothetical protein ACKO1O_14680 [Erythrobacter sp.]